MLPEAPLESFESLDKDTLHYRLHDSSMTNAKIAEYLGVENGISRLEFSPNSCFFAAGFLVAFRAKHDEVHIFHIFGNLHIKILEIANEID